MPLYIFKKTAALNFFESRGFFPDQIQNFYFFVFMIFKAENRVTHFLVFSHTMIYSKKC